MTVSEAAKQMGSRGGKKTLEKYGAQHFKRMQELSAKARAVNKTKISA